MAQHHSSTTTYDVPQLARDLRDTRCGTCRAFRETHVDETDPRPQALSIWLECECDGGYVTNRRAFQMIAAHRHWPTD